MLKRGFTLVELLVVISIVSLLASIVLGALSQSRAKAQVTERVRNVEEVQKALELYAAANGGAYPIVTNPGNTLCLDCTGTGYDQYKTGTSTFALALSPYLKILPTDPAKPAGGFTDGRGYWYKSDGKDYKFVSIMNTTETLLGSIAEYLRDYSFGQSSQIGIRKTSSSRANNWTPSCDPANCVQTFSINVSLITLDGHSIAYTTSDGHNGAVSVSPTAVAVTQGSTISFDRAAVLDFFFDGLPDGPSELNAVPGFITIANVQSNHTLTLQGPTP